MNGNSNKQALGEWADQGYFINEYADHVVTVCYKDDTDRELAAFEQTKATPEALQDVCKRHHERLIQMAEVTP